MPKVLVLFFGDDPSVSMLADAAAAGATSVRFTEVDLRSAAPAESRYKALDPATNLSAYHGIVLVAPADGLSATVSSLLDRLDGGGPLTNMVFGLAAGNGTLLERIARLGGIIVTQRGGTGAPDRARVVGARVAQVVGWVAHSLAHASEHQHGHGHEHGKPHTHTHGEHNA